MRRSRHYLSHFRLFTSNFGEMVPIGCQEILPADMFRHRTTMLVRTTPLATPVMHPVRVGVHHWFVPTRLLWDGWEKFITGQDATTALPTITVPAQASASMLLDHLGVPPEAEGKNIVSFPVRAVNLIYNEFYRDQDISAERAEDELSLPQSIWQKDYFTTARPTSQQGDEISVPVTGGEVPVKGLMARDQTYRGTTVQGYESGQSGGTQTTYQDYKSMGETAAQDQFYVEKAAGDNYPNLRVDFNQANVGILINELREAFALQRFAEARNRYGSRYTDLLRYLGVRPSDARLQRPEYLGGGKNTIAFSEVLATADTTDSKVGALKGHGLSAMRTRAYRRFFEEHGYIVSFAIIRPHGMYTQNLHRMWNRQKRDDFWTRENEIMGMQQVPTKELYAAAADNEVFGYVDRYREYREHPSMVTGEFRKSTFNDWHVSRAFTQSPVLNESFLKCVPSNRIFQNTNVPQFQVMAQHQIATKRLVSKRARG